MKGSNAMFCCGHIASMVILMCSMGCRPNAGNNTREARSERVSESTNRQAYLLLKPTGDLSCMQHDFWNMPSCREKVQIAEAFADEVLSRKLVVHNGEYDDFARDVSAYGRDVFTATDMLLEVGYDGKRFYDIFFRGMDKLRIACMQNVPQFGRGGNESFREYEKRCYAVLQLMDDYEYAMRIWELSLSRHLKVLSEPLQKEYLERRKLFLQYTSGRELREKMISGK